jgi:hypothetical protein
MLLFGIPHKGLVVDDIRQMINAEQGHPRHSLLDEISSGSLVLAYQAQDFVNIIRDRKVVSFYETRETRQLQRVYHLRNEHIGQSLTHSTGSRDRLLETSW